MERHDIVVNRDYQRTDKVWPAAARSYLIDTMLLGYPIPKLSLYQKTDLKSRKTVKEIVDGQQRSAAILAFYNNEFRISGKSDFTGKTFATLEEQEQHKFLEYGITCDLIVSATEDNIRQLFRRINSYTVPLNPQEERHAIHQGAFKWFIAELTEKYASSLKKIGVFSEKQLSRMNDAALFTEVIMAMTVGIKTASRTKMDQFYTEYDGLFPLEGALSERFDSLFSKILVWESIHDGPLMKLFNFYTLMLAVSHILHPLAPLSKSHTRNGSIQATDIVLRNLGFLASALQMEQEGTLVRSQMMVLQPFVNACSEATNTEKQRNIRFDWMCRALTLGSLF